MQRKKVFALNSLLCFVHHLSLQAVGKKNLLASKISLLLVFQCVGCQEPDVIVALSIVSHGTFYLCTCLFSLG